MLVICGKLHRTQLLTRPLIRHHTFSDKSLRSSFSTKLFRQPGPGSRSLPKTIPNRTNYSTANKILFSDRILSAFRCSIKGNGLGARRVASSTSSSAGKKLADGASKLGGKASIKRLLLLAKDEKWFLLASMGCLLVSSSIFMGVPYVIGRILDTIFTDAYSKDKLSTYCLMMGGVFLIGGIANFGRIYLMNSASKFFIWCSGGTRQILYTCIQ